MAKIVLENLAHAYGDNPQQESDYALKRINYVWNDGEACALLGPSGCGKTTLLNIISGLLEPSEGRVYFDDTDVTHVPTKDKNIAQVFQFPVVYDTMTVAQNLAFPLVNRGFDQAKIIPRVEEILDLLDLRHMANMKAKGLTADQKQKISLGRGLVRQDVNAVLFDEPLTVIDPLMKWELRSQLRALQKKVGQTMIYVTHDQIEALTFADRIAVMLDGAILQFGTPKELFERPSHTFVGYFIGSPGMNFFPCEIKDSTATVVGQNIDLKDSYGAPIGKLELGIRPEFVSLHERAHQSDGLPVVVESVEHLGRNKIVRLLAGESKFSALLSERTQIPKDPVAQFDANRICIYQDSFILEGEAQP
ncbi:ABC transporter ATP-binding protein [Candidatus Njordibacter sp. Uisw_039]|jgi:glycerol transport system ATP-binding protein|uniref:ABC transporter ATP-binding protein n=1 Tax=Candidatus Njordibacter sp. Uisw_039 TaxID=3230972 RepID=UPI003A450266|tara:strand:+ start:2940 stop:4028 length:1089 start_codon:yes stop_codon:yes gene_type:complete